MYNTTPEEHRHRGIAVSYLARFLQLTGYNLEALESFGVSLPRPPRRSEPSAANRVVAGRVDAPVTLVEYSAFDCPHCKTAFERMSELGERRDDVCIEYRHYPFTEVSGVGARYYEAVRQQGVEYAKEFLRLVYGQQERAMEGESFYREVASRTGADPLAVAVAAETKAVAAILLSDYEEKFEMQLGGTPSIVINGLLLVGACPLEAYERLVDALGERLASRGESQP